MKAKKKFDCIKMKDQIQQQILKEMQGLSPEEQRQRTEERILADPILAPIWKKSQRLPSPGAAPPSTPNP